LTPGLTPTSFHFGFPGPSSGASLLSKFALGFAALKVESTVSIRPTN
jgi:hypothetical protein